MTVYDKDINKFYTDLISDYLNKCYVISPMIWTNCRCGTNTTCINTIELVNPKIKDKIIRIFVDKDDELAYIGSTRTYVKYIHIYAKQYNYSKEDRKNNRPLWYHEDELVSSKKYYCIPNSNAYTETLDELVIIYMTRENREKQKCESKQKNDFKWINLSDLKPETIDSIMTRINHMRGFKTATASCIQKIGLRKVAVYNYNLHCEVTRISGIIYVEYKSKQTTIWLR